MSRILKISLFVVLGTLAVAYIGNSERWFRGPYPKLGKDLAWFLGQQEAAYNFDHVDANVYRSGRPDGRFVEYLKERHGLEHIISLTGESAAHQVARDLGLKVSIYHWSTDFLPKSEEFEQVQNILKSGEKVLIHCAGGSDRTGYSIATYRVRNQQWTLKDAVAEMRLYWHDSEDDPGLHAELRDLLAPVSSRP